AGGLRAAVVGGGEGNSRGQRVGDPDAGRRAGAIVRGHDRVCDRAEGGDGGGAGLADAQVGDLADRRRDSIGGGGAVVVGAVGVRGRRVGAGEVEQRAGCRRGDGDGVGEAGCV